MGPGRRPSHAGLYWLSSSTTRAAVNEIRPLRTRSSTIPRSGSRRSAFIAPCCDPPWMAATFLVRMIGAPMRSPAVCPAAPRSAARPAGPAHADQVGRPLFGGRLGGSTPLHRLSRPTHCSSQALSHRAPNPPSRGMEARRGSRFDRARRTTLGTGDEVRGCAAARSRAHARACHRRARVHMEQFACQIRSAGDK